MMINTNTPSVGGVLDNTGSIKLLEYRLTRIGEFKYIGSYVRRKRDWIAKFVTGFKQGASIERKRQGCCVIKKIDRKLKEKCSNLFC